MTDIDLHLHTVYSDGAETPETVVKRAAELGFKTIAITDHDGTGGIAEALEAGKKYGVRVIPGIELSSEYKCVLPGFDEDIYFMHILGYDIDPENEALQRELVSVMERRAFRNEQIRQAFIKKGIEISREELLENTPDDFVGKVSFARVFVKRGLCESVPAAFKSPELLAAPDIKAIRKDKISAERAFELISGAGGMAFFAHPFQLSYTKKALDDDSVYRKKLRLILEKFRELGMAGIECCYPTHTEEQMQFLLGIADGLGIAASRGSDDHGKGVRPDKQMGTFRAELPEERILRIKEIFSIK